MGMDSKYRIPQIAGFGLGAAVLGLLTWTLSGTGLCSP
jgi:hypothetical protein